MKPIRPKNFTGVARSAVAVSHGNHRNMKILTLHIKDGIVHKIDMSDHYAQFEAAQWIDHANNLSLLQLNGKWEEGKTMATHQEIYWENRDEKK